MWGGLRTFVFSLCVQLCAGQLLVRVVRDAEEDATVFAKPRGSGSALRKTSAAAISEVSNPEGALSAAPANAVEGGRVVGADQGALQPPRKLDTVIVIIGVDFIVIIVIQRRRVLTDEDVSEMMKIEADITITDPDDGPTTFRRIVSVGSDGVASAKLELTNPSQVNADHTALCEGCTLDVTAGDCVSGSCEYYDKDATNANMKMKSSVFGDPHMVGLLGQTIDWYGKDNQWYCLLSDDNIHLNVRVSAPMPERFPDRQLVSGVSLLTRDGHSLVIEVKNPYTTETEGCSDSCAKPCLADGALRFIVDGQEFHPLQTPGEDIVLPGGVVVSSANLPAECRPFGGDRIWAAQAAAAASDQMAARGGRRFLRMAPPRFDEWLLDAGTLAAPTWCAKFLEENGLAGIAQVQSNHAILRIETSSATIRVNIGVNYQDRVYGPDGTMLVPELDFWQTDLSLEGMQLSGVVSGMLGDTSRLVMDHEGVPVTSGLGALHGPVESYVVSGPDGVDFELRSARLE